MWGDVEPKAGDAHKAELMREDAFFKPDLDQGAQMAHHENTTPSAEAIIRLLIKNHPLPLQIQTELIDEHKDIIETSAGQELNQELYSQIKKHQEEIRIITEEMEQAVKDKDKKTRNELESEKRRIHKEIGRFENEAKRLGSDYRREKSEFQAQLTEMERGGQGGYCGTNYTQNASRWGGNGFRSSPSMSYRSALGFTHTTQESHSIASPEPELSTNSKKGGFTVGHSAKFVVQVVFFQQSYQLWHTICWAWLNNP